MHISIGGDAYFSEMNGSGSGGGGGKTILVGGDYLGDDGCSGECKFYRVRFHPIILYSRGEKQVDVPGIKPGPVACMTNKQSIHYAIAKWAII